MGVPMGRRTDGGGVLIFGLLLSLSNFFSTAAAPSGKVALTLKKADSRHERVSPALEPASDKQFFKKDYPYDVRPDAKHAFDHPYPAVQDSGDFASDFVKDENGDGGEWDTHMKYDTLRSKLRKQQKELEKAQATEQRAKSELEKSKTVQRKAYQEATDAKSKEVSTEEVAKEKAQKAKDIKSRGQSSGDSSDASVEDAEKSVGKEEGDLQNCQKKLREARKKLKEALEERERATGEKATADSKVESQMEAARKAEDEEELLEGTIEKEKKDYEAAVALYEKKVAELERAEQKLKAAEGKVREIRDSADADGGVYPKKVRSGGAKTLFPGVAALVASSLLVAHVSF